MMKKIFYKNVTFDFVFSQLVLLLSIFAVCNISYAEWKYINPYPTQKKLKSVWGLSSNKVYSVGHETILNYNGNKWLNIDNGCAMGDLNAIWGLSDKNIYVVGCNHSLIHFKGEEWSYVDLTAKSPCFYDIWGTSDNNIYVAGDYCIFHYDGDSWTEATINDDINKNYGSFKGIWGTISNDVYAIFNNCTYCSPDSIIYRYNGENWEKFYTTDIKINAIWGANNNSIYLVGNNGKVIYFNGVNWSNIGSVTNKSLYDIWGSSSDNVYAVGDGVILHFDGDQWTIAFNNNDFRFYSIWGSSPNDIFTVGETISNPYRGVIFHYNGILWTELSHDEFENDFTLLAGYPNGHLITFDFYDNGYLFDGDNWSLIDNISANISDIWIDNSSILYGATDQGILQFDGFSWSLAECNSFIDWDKIQSVWASSIDNIYVAGTDNIVVNYNGLDCFKYSINTTPIDFKSIWGCSNTDIFAVGDGVIIHYDGNDWMPQGNPGLNLKYIWGITENNIYAVGTDIIHYNGKEWSNVNLNTQGNSFINIHGNAINNIYAAGTSIFRYNGSKWYRMKNNSGRRVWCNNSGGAYSIGSLHSVMFHDGVNKRPTAMLFSPITGNTETYISVNAERSYDAENYTDDLEVRWDWESDGIWDTSFSYEKLAVHKYLYEGFYTITLEVRDSDNATDDTTRSINIIKVTTTSTTSSRPTTTTTRPTTTTTSIQNTAGGGSTGGAAPVSSSSTTTSLPVTTSTSTVPAVLTTSTTSVEPPAPETTTTTSIEEAKCPLQQTLGNEARAELDILRMFRDTTLARTTSGILMITLYYGHSQEITNILAANPDLMVQTRGLVLDLLPVIQNAIMTDRPVKLTELQHQRIIKLMQAVQSKASPKLSTTITHILEKVESGELLKEIY